MMPRLCILYSKVCHNIVSNSHCFPRKENIEKHYYFANCYVENHSTKVVKTTSSIMLKDEDDDTILHSKEPPRNHCRR